MKRSKEGRCQCCNNTLTGNPHLVFGDEGRTFNIARLLFSYINKKLNENDGLKYAICDSCWQQLIQYNEFQNKCIRANELANEEEELVEEIEGDTDDNDTYELVCIDKDGTSDEIPSPSHNETHAFCVSDASPKQNSNFDYQYECDEVVDDMQIEYLDENDILDEENWCNQENTTIQSMVVNAGHEKLPFDFKPVLVKPIFCFGLGNLSSFHRIFFLNLFFLLMK